MSIFAEPKKTDKELQDELRALCGKIAAIQYVNYTDMERYEDLLYEIYQRNLEPEVILKPKQ